MLNQMERYNLRRELRKMRLAQKALVLRMRSKFPVNCKSENRRREYLNWFDKETLKIAARHSDSDDDNFELGTDVL